METCQAAGSLGGGLQDHARKGSQHQLDASSNRAAMTTAPATA